MRILCQEIQQGNFQNLTRKIGFLLPNRSINYIHHHSSIQKYELKRHRTVHENIKYTCPYCEKEVKRKPSMLKHLRLIHKDKEHFWSDNDFIAQLKYYTKTTTNGFVQSESSNTNESSTDEKNNASPSKPSSSVVGSIDNGEFNAIQPRKRYSVISIRPICVTDK